MMSHGRHARPCAGPQLRIRATLEAWTRAPSMSAGAALRARIVLASAAGEGTSQLARRLGVSRPDGDRLAGALPGRRHRGPGRRAALGPAQDRR